MALVRERVDAATYIKDAVDSHRIRQKDQYSDNRIVGPRMPHEVEG